MDGSSLCRVLRKVEGPGDFEERVRGIKMSDHPFGIRDAMVLMASEDMAIKTQQCYDRISVRGRTMRVHLRRVSEINDEVEVYEAGPAPLLRRSSTDLNRYVFIFNTNAYDPPFKFFSMLLAELRVRVWHFYLASYNQEREILQVEWRGGVQGFKSRTSIPSCLQINRGVRSRKAISAHL